MPTPSFKIITIKIILLRTFQTSSKKYQTGSRKWQNTFSDVWYSKLTMQFAMWNWLYSMLAFIPYFNAYQIAYHEQIAYFGVVLTFCNHCWHFLLQSNCKLLINKQIAYFGILLRFLLKILYWLHILQSSEYIYIYIYPVTFMCC